MNQQDSEFHYFSGHTTDHPRFRCQNIMWESSEILKFKVSVGQAAWMGVSCSSFLADQGGCLQCGTFDLNQPTPVVRSRCPRFTEGQPDAEPHLPRHVLRGSRTRTRPDGGKANSRRSGPPARLYSGGVRRAIPFRGRCFPSVLDVGPRSLSWLGGLGCV